MKQNWYFTCNFFSEKYGVNILSFSGVFSLKKKVKNSRLSQHFFHMEKGEKLEIKLLISLKRFSPNNSYKFVGITQREKLETYFFNNFTMFYTDKNTIKWVKKHAMKSGEKLETQFTSFWTYFAEIYFAILLLEQFKFISEKLDEICCEVLRSVYAGKSGEKLKTFSAIFSPGKRVKNAK